jgi:DNA-binding transcriptional ArsR family regulator
LHPHCQSRTVSIMTITTTAIQQGARTDLAAAGLLLRLLADPTRMRIVELLAERDRTVGELVAVLGIPRSRLGNHLACGLHCGVWTSQKQGRNVVYSLADRGVIGLLDHAREVAAPRADHLASCARLGPHWI